MGHIYIKQEQWLKRVCHVLRPIVLVIQGPWATMERLDRGWKIIVQATYVWLG